MIPGREHRHVFLRCALCAALALCTPVTSPVHAAGTFFAWDDCRLAESGWRSNRTFGCSPTIALFPLFPGFELASPVDSVLAMELVIDVDVADAALPAWWRMDPGQCNEGGWSADTTPASGCLEAWAGQGVAAVQGWLPNTPGGSSRHGRLLVTAAASPGTLASLDADTPVTAARLLLRTENVLNCEGCSIPACLVFNSVIIRRLLAGGAEQEIVLSEPFSPGANLVLWQAGSGADCQSVPVRASTWGAVKAMFR